MAAVAPIVLAPAAEASEFDVRAHSGTHMCICARTREFIFVFVRPARGEVVAAVGVWCGDGLTRMRDPLWLHVCVRVCACVRA